MYQFKLMNRDDIERVLSDMEEKGFVSLNRENPELYEEVLEIFASIGFRDTPGSRLGLAAAIMTFVL